MLTAVSDTVVKFSEAGLPLVYLYANGERMHCYAHLIVAATIDRDYYFQGVEP
jgi:hypothetical protein